MPVYLLDESLRFPPPELASDEGLVAVGGDFSVERLLVAYRHGIFPWPVDGMPLLWFSPDPRMVIVPGSAHLSRSLRRRLRAGEFEVRADTAFDDVIDACAEIPRPGQPGTWITPELRAGYRALHRAGWAHSVEAFVDGRLVGGIYGVSLGRAFFGESMFSRVTDGSKIAMATLLGNLVAWDFAFLDCQVHTDHLERLGGVQWRRRRFLRALRLALAAPTRRGPWTLDVGPERVPDIIPR